MKALLHNTSEIHSVLSTGSNKRFQASPKPYVWDGATETAQEQVSSSPRGRSQRNPPSNSTNRRKNTMMASTKQALTSHLTLRCSKMPTKEQEKKCWAQQGLILWLIHIILCKSQTSKTCSWLFPGSALDCSGVCHLVLCLHGKGWIRPEEKHLNHWHCIPFCAESYSSFIFGLGVSRECTAQTSTASRTTGTYTSMNLRKNSMLYLWWVLFSVEIVIF